VNESAGEKLWKRRAQTALGNRRSDFHFSHSFNNNKLDDRNHFLQNAKTSVASLRRLITPTRNADHDQPGTLIIFIGIRTTTLILLFIGALFGAGLLAGLDAAQESQRIGYAYWSEESSHKLAYVIGYLEAEAAYRTFMDKALKGACGEAGRAQIEGFEGGLPAPSRVSPGQFIDGVDEFYKDWRNRAVNLHWAMNVVKLQLAGRPQSEIDEVTRQARGME